MRKIIANPERAVNPNRLYLEHKKAYLVKRPTGVWYFEFCRDGKQKRVCLGTTDYSIARDLVERTPVGEVPVKISVPKPAKLVERAAKTLGQCRDEYEEWYPAKHKDRGARVCLMTVKYFVDYFGEDKDTRSLTQKDIQEWVDAGEYGRCEEGEDDKRATSTRINEFGRLRAFIRWIVRKQENKHLLDADIVRGIDLPKDDEVAPEAPDAATVAGIIRALAGHWMHDYAIVLFETGMRPEELLASRPCDLDGDLLSIRPWTNEKYCRYTGGKWSPKSKWSIRKIRLSPVAFAIMQRLAKAKGDRPTEPLFLNEANKMYDPNHSARIWRLRLEKYDKDHGTKLKGWTPYDARHFFISEHCLPGPNKIDKDDMKVYIGHSPRSATLERWYQHRDGSRYAAPASLTAVPQETRVIELKKAAAERHIGEWARGALRAERKGAMMEP